MGHFVKRIVRGRSEQVNSYVGPAGELVMDTDAKALVMQDGETVGGVRFSSTLVATSEHDGLMSASDKEKLDSIPVGGGSSYTLPMASTTVLGGIKVGTNLSISNGVLSGNYAVATTSSAGLMSAVDKAKLDGISSGGGGSYTLPVASSSVLGGIKVGSGLSISDGVLSVPDLCTLSTAQTVTGDKTFTGKIVGKTFLTEAVVVSSNVIDCSAGTVFLKSISSDTVFTFSGDLQNKVACISLVLLGSGSYVVTWPSNVKWADGVTPTLTASGIDILTFITPDGGTTWYGTASILNAS